MMEQAQKRRFVVSYRALVELGTTPFSYGNLYQAPVYKYS